MISAIRFLHDLGELLFFQNQDLVVLSMTWLIDVMKYVIRHDHFEALQFETAAAPRHDMKSGRQFQEAKSNFINKGVVLCCVV